MKRLLKSVGLLAILIPAGIFTSCTADVEISTVENVTGNVTTTSGTWSLDYSPSTDITEIITEVDDSFQRIAGALEFGAGIFLVVSILALSLWRNSIFFYAVSGFVTFTLGITWATDYQGVSYALGFIAAYQLLIALKLSIETDLPSRGLSQFKKIYNTIKSWF